MSSYTPPSAMPPDDYGTSPRSRPVPLDDAPPSPPPTTFPWFDSLDAPPPAFDVALAAPRPPRADAHAHAHDALPQYTPTDPGADPERARRESLSAARWEAHRAREAAMARQLADDRLERQRSRDAADAQRRDSLMGRWLVWSARFYMPLMNRWGEQHNGR